MRRIDALHHVADDKEDGEDPEKRQHESEGDVAQHPALGLAQTEKAKQQTSDACRGAGEEHCPNAVGKTGPFVKGSGEDVHARQAEKRPTSSC